MRTLIKLLFFVCLVIVIITLYNNFRAGNPWTVAALRDELSVTLGLVQQESKDAQETVGKESGRVLGQMTSRMTTEPILKAITGTLSDEVQAIPYNICKPIVENYESK